MTNPTQRRHDEILGRLDALIDAARPPRLVIPPSNFESDRDAIQRAMRQMHLTTPDITYEPTRDHWPPYEPWMRDVLADDARVSLLCEGERRSTWANYNFTVDGWLAGRDARIHPDDAPERPTEDDLADMTRQRDALGRMADHNHDVAAKVKADRDEWREDAIRSNEDRNKWMSKHAEMRRERNEWRARHAALRADVEEHSGAGSLPILNEEARDILYRDDERGAR